MGFRSCEREDPFTKTVREVHRCNVVRAPRADLVPLTALARRGGKVETRGDLATLLGHERGTALAPVRQTVAPALSGQRSTTLKVGVGLELASSFLTALGIPIPGAKVDTTLWSGISQVSFEVRDVTQHEVSLSEVGRATASARVPRSPAAEIFFADRDVHLLVVVRTLTSRQFAIRSRNESGQSVGIKVDAIHDLLGASSADVSWRRESDDIVSFAGSTELTFAFAAVPCVIHDDATFYFGLEADRIHLGPGGEPDLQPKPVFDADGLVTFDAL